MSPRSYDRVRLKTLEANFAVISRKALTAARPTPARVAFDSILALDDPEKLHGILAHVANRDSYPELANRLHRVVNPYKPLRLVELILGRSHAPHVRTFRVATDCGYFTKIERENLRGKNYPPLYPEDLAAAVDNPKRRKGARVALHVLGHVEVSTATAVETASGVLSAAADKTNPTWIPIIDTAPDVPGLWPDDRKERAGLALHLLVRRFIYGEAYDSILVRR